MLVGTVVVGSISLLGASVRTHTVGCDMVKGPLLADALMAEIVSMPYYDPESGSGSNSTNSDESSVNRADFDDVGDYDDWSTSTVQDKQGNLLSEYTGWSRSVQVKWADRLAANEWWLYDTGIKRIVVTVTAPDGTVTTRFGMRSKEGSLEQKPTLDKTVVSHIESTLTLGASSETANSSINLLNHVEDPNG